MEDFQVGSKWDDILEESKKIHEKLKQEEDLNNEIQIMKYIFKNEEIEQLTKEYLRNLKPFMKKSNEVSRMIREEGNQIYKSDTSMFKCIVIYTGALMSSENASVEMAYAHSNRAAALMKMEFFKEALLDTEMAIKFNHPDLFKMYERMCESSFKLSSKEKLDQNLKKLEAFCATKPNKSRNDVIQKYRKYLELLKNVPERSQIGETSVDPKDTVKLLRNEELGRYVLAKSAIKKDEPIFVEKPFAFVPVHDGSKRITNVDCENCAASNIIPFPCFHCGRASYCSPKCLENHENIHKYECVGYQKNLWYQIGIAHLSLRTLLTGINQLVQKIHGFDLEQFKNKPEKIFQHLEDICQQDYQDYFESSQSSDEFREYGQVFALSTNFFTKHHLLFGKNFYYAITSLLMTMYLKNFTSFFQDFLLDKEIMSESDWTLFISSVLLRHIGQLVVNGHAIIDFRQTIFQMNSMNLMIFNNYVVCGGLHALLKSERIFTGIFPRISMINHSCDPNIRNVFENNQLTIFATRNLKESDQIFNCYGPNYKLMSFKERQDTLKIQYNFECKCEKCLEKNDEHRINNSFRCKSCGHQILYPDSDPISTASEPIDPLKCTECGTIYENSAVKVFYQIVLAEDKSKIKVSDAYQLYLEAIKDLNELDVVRLNMMSILLETFIRNYEMIKFFNSSIVYEMAQSLLNSKEKLYGSKSVEYVEAALFYLDVLATLKSKNIPVDLGKSSLAKIQESLKILSTKTRKIIEAYINNYIYEMAL